MQSSTGILLINLGTPDDCDVASVRRYLKEFLNDPYVIDLPYIIRKILLNFIILPTRPKQSAEAYQKIWTPEGSPLLIHSLALRDKLQHSLSSNYKVALGMRYGNPSIADALSSLDDVNDLIVIPLYPQYSTAATFSSIDKFKQVSKHFKNKPQQTTIIDYFFDHPSFIEAQAAVIKNNLKNQDAYILYSYHGLPERHLIKEGCKTICEQGCDFNNAYPKTCYRKQCYETSRHLAKTLGLSEENYTTSFQSRLGKTPWIKPYTDEQLNHLREQGIKDIAIACPAFVADCLETIEEIGMQAKEQWQSLGGESFQLLPCLNSEPVWVEALAQIIQDNTSSASKAV